MGRLIKILLLLSGWAAAVFMVWRNSGNPGRGEMQGTQERIQESSVTRAFQQFTELPELKGALVGFSLLDEKGVPIYLSPLATSALCPASALKTVTTAAALDELGPSFRFQTRVCSSVPLKGGLLDGDLILVGGGDPTLTSEEIEALADQVLKDGPFRVKGKLVADLSVFPENPTSDHWNWGDIGNAYGTGAYALNVDHNRLTVSLAPDAEVGKPAKLVGAGPVKSTTKWVNRVTTGPAGSGDQTVIYSQPFGDEVTLRGTMPADDTDFTTGGAIPDPPGLALEIFKKRLLAGGVTFENRNGPESDESARVVLASHLSQPLPEIIDHLHKVSDNLEAQCLFLTMGAKRQMDPALLLRKHWEAAGISFAAWRMLDGSGLARANMIRPLDLAEVNFAARHGEHGDRFLQSLSIYANGSISSKLGAMSGVKTEVGFLRCGDGRELTFALMANGLGNGVDFWSLKSCLLDEIRKNPPAKP